MSKESAAKPVKDEVKAPEVAQPVVQMSEQVATSAAVKKLAAKPKALKKPVAVKPAKKVSTEKPAQAEVPAAKPAKKAVVDAKAADEPKAGKAPKVTKQASKKPKMVRDSFMIPESDYALFASLKQRALTAGVEVKKSELLRASLALLAKLDDAAFKTAVTDVERIKTGRPKK